MEVWIFAGVIVLVIAFAIFAFLRYCGWRHKFEVSTGSPFIENVTLAYKFAMGPYQNCGSIFHEVDKLAPKAVPLGIYYDNPDKVGLYCFQLFFKINMKLLRIIYNCTLTCVMRVRDYLREIYIRQHILTKDV